MDAIDGEAYASMTDFELADELSKISGTPVPRAVEEIRTAEILHDTVCEPDEMETVVRQFLAV